MSRIDFPRPINRNGRKFFMRHQLEAYKRALAGLPPIDGETSVIEFVSAPQVAEELGQSRRTLGRRMAAKKQNDDQGKVA